MYIKSVDENTVDVFINSGWTAWMRIARLPTKGGEIQIEQVAGTIEMTPRLREVLKNKIKWW